MVVHNQNSTVMECCLKRESGLGSLRSEIESRGEPKGTALSGCAVHTDPSSHHLHELPADGKAQAGASIFSCGGAVGLREWLKQFRLLLRRDADSGVRYFKS